MKFKNSSWNFRNKVPKIFSSHIKKSIPLYSESHNLMANLSDFFLKEKSNCIDIGSSTGTLLNMIANRHKNKKINFYGIEIVKEMIKQAEKENKRFKNKIKYLNKDVKKIQFPKSDLIISCYTIQFIEPKYRQQLINKIYKSLNWGGAFIMFEKIRASDARFQDIYSLLYNDFKLNNKFNEKEIINKSRSLKGVLEPFSDFGNLGLLKRSGFKDIVTVFHWISFKGYLCIK
mgnify:FL=1|tara:strand:+ start:2173 stop:2865 length:693 start_codon:yes stop_codon:yes gene_type:complete